jgi:hypothetical protein
LQALVSLADHDGVAVSEIIARGKEDWLLRLAWNRIEAEEAERQRKASNG